jgi:DNA-binding MarR family transcriptional regulator
MLVALGWVKSETASYVELPIRLGKAEATRLASLLSVAVDEGDSSNDPELLCNDKAAQAATWLLKLYRKREKLCAASHFQDPSWIMLLDLFVARYRSQKISVSSVCHASLCPPTTAMRHLSALVKKGSILRLNSDHDGRLVYVELSDHVYDAIVELLGKEKHPTIVGCSL